MSWRLAYSLTTLRAECNAAAPNRRKHNDGDIGDAAHASRVSRHNPYRGVVTALDITHDPARGMDVHALVRRMTAGGRSPHPNCLVPGTRLLCADLVWRPIERLKVGDALVAFDEFGTETPSKHHNPNRRLMGACMRTAAVEAAGSLQLPCATINTDMGSITASMNHMWLVVPEKGTRSGEQARKWCTTQDLQPGMQILFFSQPWDENRGTKAGWLGGLLDGEGCLSKSSGWQVTIAQSAGPVFDRAQEIANELQFNTSIDAGGPSRVPHLRFNGGMPGVLRVLAELPNVRLRGKAVNERIWEGQQIGRGIGREGRAQNRATVQLVSPVGIQEVVALQTSTSTFVADGYFSHNCAYIISDRQVARRSNGWKWVKYTGSHPHDQHAHFAVGTGPDSAPFTALSQVDDTTPWRVRQFLGGEDDLNEAETRKLIESYIDPHGVPSEISAAEQHLARLGIIQKGRQPGRAISWGLFVVLLSRALKLMGE